MHGTDAFTEELQVGGTKSATTTIRLLICYTRLLLLACLVL